MFFKKEERRRVPRLSVYHLAKYYRLSPEPHSHIITCSVKDIGKGGVCLRTEEDLPVFSVLQLYINFPQFHEPISTLAKVMWTKKLGKGNKYEVGIQFLDIENIFQEVIAKRLDAVNKIIKKGR